MLLPLRLLSFTALAVFSLGIGNVAAATGGDCRQQGLDHLRALSHDGFAIYKQISDHGFFTNFINCGDAQFDLSTAVHESTHFITSEIDAFPLVGGGTVKRPHDVSQFFPPSRIAKQFKTDDFVTIYLRLGKASSSTDFLYLLDELNAYTHDLNAATDLKALTAAGESVDHRDGLAALMAFVAAYAETARDSEPATWSGLQEPPVAKTITALWSGAERVMAASCGIPDFGHADKGYIRKFCDAKARSALEAIIGRAPICPTACLQAAPSAEEVSAPAEDATATVASEPPGGWGRRSDDTQSTAAPSWIRHVIHFLSGPGTTDTNDGLVKGEAR